MTATELGTPAAPAKAPEPAPAPRGPLTDLWWFVAEIVAKPAPRSLATPYHAMIAEARAAAPADRAARAALLAPMVAAAIAPPPQRLLATIEPSKRLLGAPELDPRVVDLAVRGPSTALARWSRQVVAARLAPPWIACPQTAWFDRYCGHDWREMQRLLARDAATHLRAATASEPSLLVALAGELAAEERAMLLDLATNAPPPWPIAHRTILTAWRATTPRSLLGLAVRSLTAISLPPAQRDVLWRGVPASMLP